MSEERRYCPVCERQVENRSFCVGRQSGPKSGDLYARGWGRFNRHRFVSAPTTDPQALPPAAVPACPQCHGELQEIAGSADLAGPPPALRCGKCDMMWAIEGDGSLGQVLWRSTRDAGEEYA